MGGVPASQLRTDESGQPSWRPERLSRAPPFTTMAVSEVLVRTDGIPDRGSHAKQAGVAEDVGVIQDVVVVNLRTDKDVPPHVVADASADVYQEVVAAGVAGPEIEAIAVLLETVEASALP